MSESVSGQVWSARGYESNARFVADYGADLLSAPWFEPQTGQRVLDLGCGDGALTAKIAAAGADVLGFDASADLLDAARERGLSVRQGDGMSLPFEAEFDAVFTNAAIHWMPDQAAVVAGVHRALRPGGTFVGEFGGFGNVAAITTALCAVAKALGGDAGLAHENTYPTVRHWTHLLEAGGFEPESVVTFYRQTPLPTGIRGWLQTFREPFFRQFDEPEAARDMAVAALEPSLLDERGTWHADYVRLRFKAVRRD